jgi:hypothetical protein
VQAAPAGSGVQVTYELPPGSRGRIQDAVAQGPQQLWSVLQRYGVTGDPSVLVNGQPAGQPAATTGGLTEGWVQGMVVMASKHVGMWWGSSLGGWGRHRL